MYHLSIKIITRSAGRSAVASACRAGDIIKYILNPQGEKIYDPKKKQYKCKSIPATDWNERTKAEDWRASWAETANKHLAQLNHMGKQRTTGKKLIPIHSWQKEHAKLTAELREVDRDYKHLKTEGDKVNKIRADVYNILRKEQQREQPIRTQGKER